MRPVRDLYRRLFGLCERLGQYPEELEVVVASGCLSWRPPNHPEVRRHLLVMPASLRFDADSGAITLVADEAGPIEFEVDMLDAVLHPRGVFAEIEEQLSSVVTSTLDEGGRRCAPLARAQPRG